MEFLTTPDFSRWPSATPSSRPTPNSSIRFPQQTPIAPPSTATPTTAQHRPLSYGSLDKAGIKNSFQALFSPTSAPTPALHRTPNAAPGLTPFLGAMPTPNLVPPNSTLISFPYGSTPAPQPVHPHDSSSPVNPLSSPYLAAAAKEAVRREFMNMPSYVTNSHSHPASPSQERVVPDKDFAHVNPSNEASPAHAPAMPSPMRLVSPSTGDAKVPSSTPTTLGDNAGVQQNGTPQSQLKNASKHASPEKHDLKTDRPAQGAAPTSQGVPVSGAVPGMPSYMMPQGHAPPGMMMLGQQGQMMMAPAPGMYPPPGVMMFAGQPGYAGGMVMAPPQGDQMAKQQPNVKPETQEERKLRIEHEKQELIREFKKKTREAALVRFRQKRRERRFGKLIRYDCRKKLADARPRVKGRFVRMKEDEEDDECAQVVPGLGHR